MLAGLATWCEGRFSLEKEMGLVTAALPPEVVAAMPGGAGIGHVRYPTAGPKATRNDAQPFLTRRSGILLAHNGNVTNVPQLARSLREEGWHVLSQCDAEPILLVLAEALTRVRPEGHDKDDVVEAVREVQIESVEPIPWWLFWKSLAKKPDLFSGSTWNLTRRFWLSRGWRVDGCKRIRLVGCAWFYQGRRYSHRTCGLYESRGSGGLPTFGAQSPRDEPARPCVFERIYFARPDSVMEEGRINRVRWRLGRQLGRQWRARGLNSGFGGGGSRYLSSGCAGDGRRTGLPHREGFIKNRYSGRTLYYAQSGYPKCCIAAQTQSHRRNVHR